MSAEWRTPSGRPVLAAAEVHVWLAHLPSARGELENLRALLTPEELERARRFRTELLRERWELTRGMLRSLLADYLVISARDLIFQLGPHGKPALAAHPQFFFKLALVLLRKHDLLGSGQPYPIFGRTFDPRPQCTMQCQLPEVDIKRRNALACFAQRDAGMKC